MKKTYLRRISIFLGIAFLIFITANFGLNFWLKEKLPSYIKNNTDYKISYQFLDVNLGTGAIFATGITVNNKNSKNHEVIGLQGTIDTLSIARFGIYDAVFNKRINTSDLLLKNPNLNIILAKPIDKKTGQKRNPIVLENIRINDGNIKIFKAAGPKFLSVNDLNLAIENLQMTEEFVENKLPVVFDKYSISGKKFFFRPNNLYAVTAETVATNDAQMILKNFALTPLLSQQNFIRYYPKQKQLFNFKTSEMKFTDIALKDNKVSLSNAKLDNPELKIYTSEAKPLAQKKDFNFELNLENIVMNRMKLNILKPNGTSLLDAENLNLDIDKIIVDKNTTLSVIPFTYQDFKVSGQNINYIAKSEAIKIAALSMTPKDISLQNFVLKPVGTTPDKLQLDVTGKSVILKINEWKLIKNKLKLDIKNVVVNEANGKISAPAKTQNKKSGFAGIEFPLTVRNVQLKNSNLEFNNGKQPLNFSNLNATVQNIEMNGETVKNSLPFKTGNYSITTHNFNYKTQFYNISAGILKINNKGMQISGFAMKPTVSRAQFIRMIPTEKDLYDLQARQITVNGSWDLISQKKFIDASQVTLDGVNANIFRSKIPKDDLTEKPMYSKLLRSIKFPMFVQNLDIKNSLLVYEEDTKKSDGPGKLTFDQFNLNAKNLNSAKNTKRPTNIPIAINCRFMDASPMKVKWNFDTISMNNAFSISGNIADLPASRINPFIEPYLKIQATGLISNLTFNFKGNNNGLNGSLNMQHQDLRVAVLKETGEKNKLLSAVANIFVRTDSGNYPESVIVENVQRDKTKSFFNLFWRGIEQGLKKTLIGKNAPKTEKAIKNTVTNTKVALENNKKDLNKTTQEIKDNNGKRKPLLKKIFKKKNPSHN